LARDAGLRGVQTAFIEIPTEFRDFDDFWLPFTLGTGPAPAYCMALAEKARQRLREKLRETLAAADGPIRLTARALALKAAVP
jgi:hypothetical protein